MALDDWLGGYLGAGGARGTGGGFGLGDAGFGGGGMPWNTMAGLGLGLMSGTKYNPYGNVMSGFAWGANADAQNAYRRALLADRASDNAFRREESARAQRNADRDYAERVRQFDEGRYAPASIEAVTQEDEYGNPLPPKYILKNPKAGTMQEITPQQMRAFGDKVSMGGSESDRIIPGTNSAMSANEDETAMPPAARLAQAAQPPQIPPGVNRKEYVKKYSDQMGTQAGKNTDREAAGGRVMALIDNLYKKTSGDNEKLFEEAAGPMQAEVSNSPMWDPRRLAYEYTPLGPSKEAQGYLRQVESDVQAINSELQRAYLSGQGSVTENERLQINKILGQIPAARSAKEAQDLLNNAKSILGTAMQRGYAVPSGAQSGGAVRTFNPQTGRIE